MLINRVNNLPTRPMPTPFSDPRRKLQKMFLCLLSTLSGLAIAQAPPRARVDASSDSQRLLGAGDLNLNES